MKKKWMLLTAVVFLDFPSKADLDKTFLVTASTGALGESIAENLCTKGYNLVLAGRDLKKLLGLQKKLQQKCTTTLTLLQFDYEDSASIQKAATTLASNSLAGVVLITPRPVFSPVPIPPPHEWQTAFTQTFTGPLETLRQFDSKVAKQGSIVLISGLTSKIYMPAYPNSNVIRVAWTGELKNLIWHFGTRRIRVNAVSPGVILTDHNLKKIEERAAKNHISYDVQLAQETQNIPLKRYGKPEDVSEMVAFLLSDQAAHLNGENIALEGGQSISY